MSIVCEVPKADCNNRASNKECLFKMACSKIIEQCVGCNMVENDYCKAYVHPKVKWMAGNCSLASHIILEVKELKKMNPLKQSKHSYKK